MSHVFDTPDTPPVFNYVFKPVVTMEESLIDSNWLPYSYYLIECDDCGMSTGLMYRKWWLSIWSSLDGNTFDDYPSYKNGNWLCNECLSGSPMTGGGYRPDPF